MRVYNGDSRRNVSDRFRAAIRETRTAKTFLGIWGRGGNIDETDNFLQRERHIDPFRKRSFFARKRRIYYDSWCHVSFQ